jgi:hypothetical protein
MAFVSAGKGIVKGDLRFFRRAAQYPDGSPGNANNTCSMGTGRTDHYGSDHIKNTAFISHTLTKPYYNIQKIN